MNRIAEAKDRIIVALDVSTTTEAIHLVEELRGHVGMFKVGLELFMASGRDIVKRIQSTGQKVFLDLKFIDNPSTMAKAVYQAAKLQPEFISIHSSCGDKSMKAAIENKGDSKLLAITVLTAFTNEQSFKVHGGSPSEKVFHIALNACNLGIDGIVCGPTPNEVGEVSLDMRTHGLIKVTPSIRPIWSKRNDQHRIATPYDAIKNGADYLVIGRPITDPPEFALRSPARAVELIVEEINAALSMNPRHLS